jgi:hypothetical protein
MRTFGYLAFVGIIIGVILILLNGCEKNYINKHIPNGLKYQTPNDSIPMSLAVPRVKMKIGNSMEYLTGSEYDTMQMRQRGGVFYCKNKNKRAKIIKYYSHTRSGNVAIGGSYSRMAIICDYTYWISDYDIMNGPTLYGPFSIISKE